MKDTVRVLSLIWLYLAAVTAVDSEYFKQVTVKRKLHFLWRGRKASSHLRCAAECVSDTSCAAHVYNATTSTCQGYRPAIQHEIVLGTGAREGYAVYYLQRHVLETSTGAPPEAQTHRTADIRETTTDVPPETQTHRTAGPVGINQNCNKSTKCLVPNSRCSRGTCKCVPGYYHQKTKNTCSRRHYKRTRDGTVGINQNCNKSTKCHVPNSRCSRGICKCVQGYYHQKTKNKCSKRPVGINQNCNKSTKCHVPNSRCSRGICKCVQGYYHQKTKNKCSKRPVGINQNCNKSTKCHVPNSRCSRGICKCVQGYYPKKTKNTCLRSSRGTKERRSSFQQRGARRTKKRGSSYQSGGYPGGVAGARGMNERGSLYQSGGYRGTGGIKQMCPRNGQCRVVNSVCHKDRCKCTPGFSYNIPAQTCVRRCQRYGTTASMYMGLGITGHNDKNLEAHSSSECMSMCASETSFLCLSFDYKLREGCHMSSYGYLDVREKYRETDSTGWIFGTRNCASYPHL